MVFITDSTAVGQFEKYKYTFPQAKFYQHSESYENMEGLRKLMVKDKENLVILETDLMEISESVINKLYVLNKGYEPKSKEDDEDENKNKDREIIQYQIRLFTSNRNDVAFGEVIENKALTALHFTYVSISKHDVLETNALIEDFIAKYGYVPNRFTVRAFDLTYDILLRLAYAGDLKDKSTLRPLTEYNENRFGYHPKFMSEHYSNDGLYLIQYQPDFNVEIINSKSN